MKDAVQSGGLIDYIFPILSVSHHILPYIPGEGKGSLVSETYALVLPLRDRRRGYFCGHDRHTARSLATNRDRNSLDYYIWHFPRAFFLQTLKYAQRCVVYNWPSRRESILDFISLFGNSEVFRIHPRFLGDNSTGQGSVNHFRD